MKKLLISLFILMLGGVFGICYSLDQQPSGEEEGFVYEDHGKRDPLWPLVSPTGNVLDYEKKEFQFTDLKLEGIIFGPDGRNLGIINGRIIKEKDQIGPFIVISIGKDSVVLGRDQQEFQVRLEKPNEDTVPGTE